MNWIYRHLRALWGRLMVCAEGKKLDALERKQRAARGVAYPNNGKPLHVRGAK